MIASERSQIGNLPEAISTARRIASQKGFFGLMRWGRFTAAMGGKGAWEAKFDTGSTAPIPYPRYIYTCRCGLIDLRHFYQLMYIAVFLGESAAVRNGLKHERSAEASSRFAPEDMTSNALGAEFGSQRSIFQEITAFVTEMEAFLQRCVPVDWHSLTQTQQDCIVNWYAVDRDGDTHRRVTAGGDGDPCGICTGDSSFPFTVDPETENRITGEIE